MKIRFKNKTKYTKNTHQKYLEFHRKQYRTSYLAYTLIMVFLFLFCVILQVQAHNMTLAILFCTILSCFILWRYLHPIAEVKKDYNSDMIQKEKVYIFTFYDKKLEVREIGKTTISSISYYKFHKVYETKDFFYLYLDRRHSLLLKKDSFVKGSPEDFSNFIAKKCLFKYRDKRKVS